MNLDIMLHLFFNWFIYCLLSFCNILSGAKSFISSLHCACLQSSISPLKVCCKNYVEHKSDVKHTHWLLYMTLFINASVTKVRNITLNTFLISPQPKQNVTFCITFPNNQATLIKAEKWCWNKDLENNDLVDMVAMEIFVINVILEGSLKQKRKIDSQKIVAPKVEINAVLRGQNRWTTC